MQWTRRDPRRELELTDRQEEVIRLIARGYTNPQIADELGISLDGAKWHVREIIGKLGVTSREEAAAYWREHRRPGARLSRVLSGLPGLAPLKWVGVGAALVVVVAGSVTVAAVMAFNDGSAPPNEPLLSPTAEATSPATATVSPTPSGPREVTGLFSEPRDPTVADRLATLGTPPAPNFPWDGESTIIYDRETGEVMNLGRGTPARFSRSGEWAVWASAVDEPEWPENPSPMLDVVALNLMTGERHDLGPGRRVFRFEDAQVVVGDGTNLTAIDLVTGAREALPSEPDPYRNNAVLTEPMELRQTARYEFEVYDRTLGSSLLILPAARVSPLGPMELVMATVPVDDKTNIFVVDIPTAQATFIATVDYRSDVNWALTGNGVYLAWADAYCGDGVTTIVDRQAGGVTQLENFWVEAGPGALLGYGEFGPTALFDPRTLEFETVLPGNDVQWSSDFRYASLGIVGGHGGYCGGLTDDQPAGSRI